MLWGINLGVELLDYMEPVSLFEKLPVYFHSHCTALRSHQQDGRVPVSPRPCQWSLLSACLILTLLLGEMLHLVVDSVCIFLVTKMTLSTFSCIYWLFVCSL